VGVAVGLVVLIGGAAAKSRLKKSFVEDCSHMQTMQALGLKNAQYLGESKQEPQWLHETHLLPSTAVVTQPLVLHAVQGEAHGTQLWMGEVTFGCNENGKKAATYSSGVLVKAPLRRPVADKALFLGRYAFKHAALRAEYEKDGLRLSPAGGKEKGWYALTEGAVSPDGALCEKWDAVCAAAKNRAALYVEGEQLAAYFYGSFYTGEFPLEEEVTAGTLKRHAFAAIVPLMELVEYLNA